MRRTLKWTLTGFGIVVILIVLFFGGYMIKAKSEIKLLSPVETKEIEGNSK